MGPRFRGDDRQKLSPRVRSSERMISKLRCGKGVAACNRARAEAGVEPTLALLGGSVREGIRNRIAARASLQRVVSDRGRGAQGRFHVAWFDERRLALAL